MDAIDLFWLEQDRLICSYLKGGVVIDPGPGSCLPRLRAALDDRPLDAILLTHVHLDHSGATGTLLEDHPTARVFVHERGVPHLIDPSRLLASAGRVFGDDLERFWGSVQPVPADRVVSLRGGETVCGFEVKATPGHASHHVSYLDQEDRRAYVGDLAGVRIPPAETTLAPTPPPEADVQAWRRSLELIGEWRPTALCLTHFGVFHDVNEQIERVREALDTSLRLAKNGDQAAFIAASQRIAAQGGASVAKKLLRVGTPDHSYIGLTRYLESTQANPAKK